ncbi:tripartite motif-containing protein 16-like protein [Hoplias malabaricus]|uniref:tripartite motif-containing protein 16-like protein n=1 Tax=Hoplias malabaricus TaxID=27720 RepID=UPI003461F966
MRVEWLKVDLTTLMVHLYINHEDRTDKQAEAFKGRTSLFKDELKTGNTSLKLSAVQPSDEGLYNCLIQSGSESDDANVYLSIRGSISYAKLKLPPVLCKLIAYIFLHIKVQNVFDVNDYNTNLKGYEILFTTMTNFKKALLAGFNLTEGLIKKLNEVLLSENSSLKELDLSYTDLEGSRLKMLTDGLKRLEQLRLSVCNLGEDSCKYLSSVLQQENSLKELDLSNNDLQDSGVKELCEGLKSSHCKLETLRLSGCMITEDGCTSLYSALSSKTSHLKELDLSYNHPGERGKKLLCTLAKLSLDKAGKNRIIPGLKKYDCELTLDPKTAHPQLALSEGNRKVKRVWRDQPYPDHPKRFDRWEQVLCRESLTGRCYWETEWSGKWEVYVSVAYKSIRRKGLSDCWFGENEKSWSLSCSDNSYSVHHNKNSTDLPPPPSSSNRVGVYVDYEAGTLSFYSVSTDTHTLTHLHTFTTIFTEPLFAGFWLGQDCSVSLC